jgi:uncharacterized protein YbjQ (UPF0145 family)
MWELLIQIGPVVLLLILGFSIGGWVERRHFRKLEQREAALTYMVLTDLKTLPEGCAGEPAELVTGEVVIASDYFKSFAANLKKLVGGELRTYESLLERGRREAILRMMEMAQRIGANAVYNVRLTTSNLGSVRRKKAAAMAEVLAYGTAVRLPEPVQA